MPISHIFLYLWALFGSSCCSLWTDRPKNPCREQHFIHGTVHFTGQSPNTVGCFPTASRFPRCIPGIVTDLRERGIPRTCNESDVQFTSEVILCEYNGRAFDCYVDITDLRLFLIDLQPSTGGHLCSYTNLLGERHTWPRRRDFATVMIGRTNVPRAASFTMGVGCGDTPCDVHDLRLMVVKNTNVTCNN